MLVLAYQVVKGQVEISRRGKLLSVVLLVLSAIYMFVFLTNEHIAANFASFAIVKFSVAADSIANFGVGNMLRHWGVTFVGNLIGGGLLMGLPYAFLNKNEDTYVD